MNMGAVIDKLIWFGLGIYFIFLSIKQKEKLANKAALIRFLGIVLIFVGVLFTLLSIIAKR
jgi:uncharacterized membrane protein YhaH (DUF805 family)